MASTPSSRTTRCLWVSSRTRKATLSSILPATKTSSPSPSTSSGKSRTMKGQSSLNDLFSPRPRMRSFMQFTLLLFEATWSCARNCWKKVQIYTVETNSGLMSCTLLPKETSPRPFISSNRKDLICEQRTSEDPLPFTGLLIANRKSHSSTC